MSENNLPDTVMVGNLVLFRNEKLPKRLGFLDEGVSGRAHCCYSIHLFNSLHLCLIRLDEREYLDDDLRDPADTAVLIVARDAGEEVWAWEHDESLRCAAGDGPIPKDVVDELRKFYREYMLVDTSIPAHVNVADFLGI